MGHKELAEICVFGLMLLTLIYLVSIWYLQRYLAIHHRPTWEAMGKPTLIRNNSLDNTFALLSFVVTRRYRNLGDAKLNQIGGIVLILFVTNILLFASLVLFT